MLVNEKVALSVNNSSKQISNICLEWLTTDRIISATYAEHGDGYLIHIPQRVISFPVGLPGPLYLRPLQASLAEQHLLHGSQ
uniref:Uncharacterized protein n=1 Tax=Pygocentrus nattereri TaxID=42514 RepID=A0A3B4DMG3_PYGNA